jgi:hypothetical protein
MSDCAVRERLENVSQLAQAICDMLEAQLTDLGLPQDKVNVAPYHEAEFRLDRDPASGEDSLVGVWRDSHGGKCGELLFHADGSFFAEYDIIHIHPQKPRWFIEAVTAWGRGPLIKAELRLLPVAG